MIFRLFVNDFFAVIDKLDDCTRIMFSFKEDYLKYKSDI